MIALPDNLSNVQRAVIEEAWSWTGTPWKHCSRIKGVRGGVDCAQFLCAVFEAVGLIPHVDLGQYPIDWHLHRDEPKFLQELAKWADRITEPQPGDVAMFRFGRHAAHGSIVVDFPIIIHAYFEARSVVLDHADKGRLEDRLAGFWRIRT